MLPEKLPLPPLNGPDDILESREKSESLPLPSVESSRRRRAEFELRREDAEPDASMSMTNHWFPSIVRDGFSQPTQREQLTLTGSRCFHAYFNARFLHWLYLQWLHILQFTTGRIIQSLTVSGLVDTPRRWRLAALQALAALLQHAGRVVIQRAKPVDPFQWRHILDFFLSHLQAQNLLLSQLALLLSVI
jgi:hypothetical protein